MKTTCPNCGKEFELTELMHDQINLEGFHALCSHCDYSFDLSDLFMDLVFVTDVAKMSDFNVISKEEFLESYSYLTEDEYDATALYLNWLTLQTPCSDRYLKLIEQKAVKYEQGKMMRDDSEVEIDISDGDVFLCDYSPSRQGAEKVEIICRADKVDLKKLKRMCDGHGWGWVG